MSPRLLGLACLSLFVAAGVVHAQQVGSDRAAAILVFPKVVVDTNNNAGRGRLDTLIRISNTLNKPVRMQCFWVNANGHCFNAPGIICDPTLLPRDDRCPANSVCVPGWQETDFIVQLTARQPVAWLASMGATLCTDTADPNLPCFPITGAGRPSPTNNLESRVPAVQEDPFVGELKCIAVDQNDVPIEDNALKGEALIVRSDVANNTNFFDVGAYNAIGIPALAGRNNRDNVLILGGNGAEYAGCPNVLILDHFFDGAVDPVAQQSISTSLTLVPCTEDFLTQRPTSIPVQFLVFNEFEQRFSTSFRDFNCFREFRLSEIDTRVPTFSIFHAGVSGTLTGQTRIRGVAGNDRTRGQTLLGVAEEMRVNGGSAAFQVHMQGTRPQSDFVYLPLQ